MEPSSRSPATPAMGELMESRPPGAMGAHGLSTPPPTRLRRRFRIVRPLAVAACLSVVPIVTWANSAGAGAAPECVHADNEGHFWANHVHVANRCRSWQRVKVILRYWPDGGCVQLAPGESFTHSHRSGKFDGLQSC